VPGLRRNFRTDKRGEFFLTVKVRKDILSGYIPQRQWMVGVTGTSRFKPSSSDWVVTEEGPPPAPRKKSSAQGLQKREVTIKAG
jgi:hypothetical protein